MVIDRYKSGFQPPRDIPFEDLSAIRSGDAPPVTNQYIKARPDQNMTVRGTISAGKLKRRVALFGIFGSNKVGALQKPVHCISTTRKVNLKKI